MENRLFAEIGTDIRVRQKAMSFVTSARDDVEDYLKRARALQMDVLKQMVAEVLQKYGKCKRDNPERPEEAFIWLVYI
jgi:hypothetical protein